MNAPVVIQPPSPLRNNLFALGGDSRPAADHVNSAGLDIYHNSTGIGWWVQNLTRGRVRFRYSDDYAVGGSTSEDLLNNQLASLLASTASNVLVLSSINDQAANSWAATRSIAALKATLRALLGARKWVYLVAELPRGSSVVTGVRFSANMLKEHEQVRSWMLGLTNPECADYMGPNLTVIDAYPAVADLTSSVGDWLAVKTYDGVHPSISGAYEIANVIASHINARFPPLPFLSVVPTDLYDASRNPIGNLLPNGQMSGTSGSLSTITGSLATGWSGSVAAFTGLTGVAAKVTTATGDWQQLTISGNSPAGVPIAAFSSNITYANATIGDRLELCGEFEVDAASVGLNGFAASLARLNSGTSRGFSRPGANASGPWPSVATSGIWRTPALVAVVGDENTIQAAVQAYLAPSTTGVAAVLRWRNMSIRKIV